MLTLVPALSAAAVLLRNHLPSLFADGRGGEPLETRRVVYPSVEADGGAGEIENAMSSASGQHSLVHRDLQYDDHDEPSALEMAKAVVIIFLSGVAVLIGIVILVYVVALFVERFCCCCAASFAALHTDGPRYVRGGEVARGAGLSGMSSEERRKVLERVLVGQPYTKPPICPDQDANEKHGCPSALHVASTDEKSLCTVPSADSVDESKMPSGGQSADEEMATDSGPPSDCQDPQQAQHVPDCDECAICINEYEEGDQVIVGAHCSHMFHRTCLLEWLEKHDVCPYCRKAMMTSNQMREAAEKVLGNERLVQLSLVHVGFYDDDSPVASASLPAEAGGLEEMIISSSRDAEAHQDGFADEENTPTNSTHVSATLNIVDIRR